MKLSKRLIEVLRFIPQDAIVADVGTDHGLLLIEAVSSGKITKGYGLDVAPLPLSQAEKNIATFGLKNQISLELRNGLEAFKGNANCFVVAGMGAETILSILDTYTFKPTDTIILQSNTKWYLFRSQLASRGFLILDEKFLIDKKIPTLILVVKKVNDNVNYSNEASYLGPILMETKPQEYLEYLSKRKDYLERLKVHKKDLHDEYSIIKQFIEKE